MTQDELLARVSDENYYYGLKALANVIRLHKSVINALPVATCLACQEIYPCDTIKTIEEELNYVQTRQ